MVELPVEVQPVARPVREQGSAVAADLTGITAQPAALGEKAPHGQDESRRDRVRHRHHAHLVTPEPWVAMQVPGAAAASGKPRKVRSADPASCSLGCAIRARLSMTHTAPDALLAHCRTLPA
jgi:hypothetical protein